MSPPDGLQFANGHSVPSNDERITLIKGAHNAPAIVAQFTLRNLPLHVAERSTGATRRKPETLT